MDILIKYNWGPYSEGQILKVPCKNGIPTSPYWRSRIKDSLTDKCCEVLPRKEPAVKTRKTKTQPKGEG